jgi:glutamyl-tRNA synthetase
VLEPWSAPGIHEAVARVASELALGLGKVAQPLRVAVSGRAATPGIDVTLWLVGREASLRRIDQAIDYIEANAAN